MKKHGKYFYLFIKDEKGAMLILVALAMVMLLGMAALAVDAGNLYRTRRQMVTAADAAALAGAKTMALGGSNGDAIAVAQSLALANQADLIHHIAIEEREYEGATFKVVVANVGSNEELYFARIWGLLNQDVNAYAVATWGYPTMFCNFLPIFYILEEGYALPEGEQILLGEMLIPGNWGFIDIGQGQAGINDALRGNAHNICAEIGDDEIDISETKPGDANSRINAVGDRMQKAHNEQDPSIMEGVIPILRYIEGQGKTDIVIVGFAPFRIRDVITALVKEDDNKWYSRGHEKALLHRDGSNVSTSLDYSPPYNAPIYYGEGHDKRQDVEDFYPRAAILGEFYAEEFIPAWEFSGSLSQDPDNNFGIQVIKLVE